MLEMNAATSTAAVRTGVVQALLAALLAASEPDAILALVELGNPTQEEVRALEAGGVGRALDRLVDIDAEASAWLVNAVADRLWPLEPAEA